MDSRKTSYGVLLLITSRINHLNFPKSIHYCSGPSYFTILSTIHISDIDVFEIFEVFEVELSSGLWSKAVVRNRNKEIKGEGYTNVFLNVVSSLRTNQINVK